jgi:hypothetical protein
MNYPVWDIPFLGAGLVVAIIAIIHVLIAHVAIGGGAFLFIAEIWSDRQPNAEAIRAWLHKYATWFLVYTTVIGAVTGVGIWFSIQLASPEGTSLLIHQFVFAWAIEWVMFLGELTILYLYFYGWKKNSRGMQVFLAGAYFVIAWLSLFIINGILTFMLTPGVWSLENTSIVAGFFNPGYFPSLLIRTLIMFMLGGLFGIIVATRLNGDDGFREKVIRFSVKWVLPAALIIPLLMIWYWSTLPQATVDLFREGSTGVFGGRLEALNRYFWLAILSGCFIVLGTAVIAIRPKAATTAGTIALFLIAQFGFMGAEFFREMARKPYVVYGVLYSNSLWQHDADDPEYLAESFLPKARWNPEVEPVSLEHGEWLFRLQCVSCHTWDAYRSLGQRTEEWTPEFGFRWLETMEETGVMPPFQGNEEDRAALAAWIAARHGEVVDEAEDANTGEGGGR